MRAKTLKLTIKREYFQMILNDIKKEEYRSLSENWINRFILEKETQKGNMSAFWGNKKDTRANTIRYLIDTGNYGIAQFDSIKFFNGGHFSEKLPNLTVECKGIEIGTGKPEWGYSKDFSPYFECFILKLGKIISANNCENKN